jgi:hypothetical protein
LDEPFFPSAQENVLVEYSVRQGDLTLVQNRNGYDAVLSQERFRYRATEQVAAWKSLQKEEKLRPDGHHFKGSAHFTGKPKTHRLECFVKVKCREDSISFGVGHIVERSKGCDKIDQETANEFFCAIHECEGTALAYVMDIEREPSGLRVMRNERFEKVLTTSNFT